MGLLSYTRRLISENLGLKATSLALALLMWLTLSSEPPVEKTISVPLEYKNIPPGLEFSSPPTWNIDVHVRIPGRARSISESDFSAFVDLKGVTEGEKVVHLNPQDNVRAPFKVDVLQIVPPRITLVLERTIEHVVPIHPAVEGVPAPSYEVTRTVVFPASIAVSGPRSRVEKITSARTETISIAGKSSDVVALANVIVDDPNVRQDTKPVQVKVDIREKRKEILVVGVPIDRIPPDAPVTLQPAKLNVLVSAPVSFNQPVNPEAFHASARITESAYTGVHKVVPSVEIKKEERLDMRILSFSPAEVAIVGIKGRGAPGDGRRTKR